MYRTIEQWRDFDCADAAYNDPREFICVLLQFAISDLQELARQLETERAAWSAKRTELLRNNDAELARRKVAEAQRDELLHMLDGIDDAELLDVLGCDNFNRYMDISKGNV